MLLFLWYFNISPPTPSRQRIRSHGHSFKQMYSQHSEVWGAKRTEIRILSSGGGQQCLCLVQATATNLRKLTPSLPHLLMVPPWAGLSLTLRHTVAVPYLDLHISPFPLEKFQVPWNIQARRHQTLVLAQLWRMIKHAVIPQCYSAAEQPWWRWLSTEKDMRQTRKTLLLSQAQNNLSFPPLSTWKFSPAGPPVLHFTCTNCSLFLSALHKTTGVLYTEQLFFYLLQNYICPPAWRDHKKQRDTCSSPVNRIL